MVDEVRPQLPALEHVVVHRDRRLGRSSSSGPRPSPPTRPPARRASCTFDDPINIQYTSGTTGFPKGATLSHHNILNNGYFIGGGMRLHRSDRVCIPVPLYHCFGMVMGNLGCTTHGATMVYPGAGVRPAGDADARSRPSAARASTACRRCSSPSSAIRSSPLRPVLAAHRDHGRLTVPGRGDEAGDHRDAHGAR